MNKIAVIRNPTSSKNVGRPSPSTLPANIRLVEPENTGQVLEVLRKLNATCDIDILVIDGGDGTVRDVITHVFDAFDGKPPIIGIMAHGNTNLVARKLKGRAGYIPLHNLQNFTVSDLEQQSYSLPVVKLDFPESDQTTLRGFIVGWGAYARGTRLAVQEIPGRGRRQVARTFLTMVRKATIGPEARILRKGIKVEIDIEGHSTDEGRRLIGIASTFPGKLLAGFQPFWGSGTGALRWLDIRSSVPFFVIAAPFVALGKPMGWMKKSGYQSGRTRHIRLKLSDELILDGEFVKIDTFQTVSISANETVKCLRVL